MFVQEKSVRKKLPGWEQKHIIYSPSARVRLQISGDCETTSSCKQESKLNNSFHLVQEKQTEWSSKELHKVRGFIGRREQNKEIIPGKNVGWLLQGSFPYRG